MLVGFTVGLGWHLAGPPLGIDAVVPGVLSSVAAFLVVSRLTRPPGQEAIDRFFPSRQPAPATPQQEGGQP